MERDRKISIIINLAAVFIVILTLLIFFVIYRERIFDSLSKPPVDESETEITLEITTLEITTLPEQETETDEDLTDSMIPEGYIEVPKSDFMQAMFDNAIEIPGSGEKIELPPAGRSEELQQSIVPLSEYIPEPFEYFKNIVFLGDSVTSGFDLYKIKIKYNEVDILRDVNVIAVAKYGVYYAIQPISDTSSHPLSEGKQTLPEDIIAEKDAKNVFICLGLNDLTFARPVDFVKYYATLIERIKEKSPDKNIVIMSVTPLVEGQEAHSLNNNVIIEANNALLEFAKENGISFIDYAAAIRDENNNLPEEWSSDGYCHITTPAYERLVEYLLHHPIKN